MAKDSTRPTKTGRPQKGKRRATHPYLAEHPDFPLSFHAGSNNWYKTSRGKRFYFGPDPIEAKRRFDSEWSYIVRGLPVPEAAGVTVGELVNLWLDDRDKDVQDGRLKRKTWTRYQEVGTVIVAELGRQTPVSSLTPDDFGKLHRALMDKTKDSPTVGRFYVNVSRMPWRWSEANGVSGAVAMGSRFKPPPKSAVRIKRRKRGRQTFTADEIKTMLDDSRPFMRAAILLGLNGGYTQAEVAELRRSWLDLDAGTIDHLRGKTAFARRVTLWPETVEAIEAMPKYQPRGKDAKDRLFLTRTGRAYGDDGANGIAQAFTRLMKKHKIELEQSGFGKLRATHRTVADEVKDANACRLIMGHALGQGSEEHYIEGIADDRLRAVTDHVRAWLFDNPS